MVDQRSPLPTPALSMFFKNFYSSGTSGLSGALFGAVAVVVALAAPVAAQSRDRILEAAQVGSQSACARGLAAAPEAGAKPLAVFDSRKLNRQFMNARDWELSDGLLVRLSRFDPPNRPALFFAAVYSGTKTGRPFLRLARGEDCAIRGGERIEYARDPDAPAPARLVLLDRNMKLRAAPIPLNPKFPDSPRAAPGCLPVAALDNGVNYLLPELLPLLARDAEGDLLGYDFWEKDALPFDQGVPIGDLDPRVSAFEPPTHGTSVASAFVGLSPEDLCLAPYRYAPQRANRHIGEMVGRMAEDGVRVVVLTSGREMPWPEFAKALDANPEMLFISAAGNNGLDLNKVKVFPMIYARPNLLVVGATDAEGAMWERSNFGERIVEVAVPAVALDGMDWSGKDKKMTGTSFSAPRVAVLAGLVAKANPNSDGAALKAQVLQLFEAYGRRDKGAWVLPDTALKAVVESLTP